MIDYIIELKSAIANLKVTTWPEQFLHILIAI